MLVTCLMVAGCAQDAPDYSRFVPAPEQARIALEAAFAAWKEGRPAGEEIAADLPVKVRFIDSRQLTQKLMGYEILGDVPGDGPRTIAVNVTLGEPPKTTKDRYYIVGIDPIWVYQQEDYDMISHWEHPMEEPASKDKAGEKPQEPSQASDGS